MEKYLQIINIRTLIVLLICLITSFFVIHFGVRYDFDLTIISIAIIFPLVILYHRIGLLDTRLGLALAHAAMNLPFAVLLMKSFFISDNFFCL